MAAANVAKMVSASARLSIGIVAIGPSKRWEELTTALLIDEPPTSRAITCSSWLLVLPTGILAYTCERSSGCLRQGSVWLHSLVHRPQVACPRSCDMQPAT